MKRIFKFLFIFLMLLSVFQLSVSAEYYDTAGVYDEAELIPPDDEAEIEKYLHEAAAKTGVRYILVTTTRDENISYRIDRNADALVICILYLNGTYYYEPYTYGDAEYGITDSEAERVFDAASVYDNLKSGNIKEGTKALCELSAVAINGKLREPLWQTVFICFIIASIIAGITVGCVVYNYKKKLKAPAYPLDRYANMRLASNSDTFLGSFVTKTRISSSSSGGRSGGGRSGGSRGGSRGRR